MGSHKGLTFRIRLSIQAHESQELTQYQELQIISKMESVKEHRQKKGDQEHFRDFPGPCFTHGTCAFWPRITDSVSTWGFAGSYKQYVQSLSHVQLFLSLWTVAHEALLSMGFSRQGYWSVLPFPSPGDLSNLGIKSLSPALAGRFFTAESPRKPTNSTQHF